MKKLSYNDRISIIKSNSLFNKQPNDKWTKSIGHETQEDIKLKLYILCMVALSMYLTQKNVE